MPGLDSPLQQFVRGQTETLTIDLFFDTTDYGMGAGATSVTSETDKIYQLIKIEPRRHAPPILTFVWADQFPGSSTRRSAGRAGGVGDTHGRRGARIGAERSRVVAGAAGAAASSALAAIGAALGGQRRNGMRCVLQSIKQKFTLFSPEGVPLRATLTVSFREYKTLENSSTSST